MLNVRKYINLINLKEIKISTNQLLIYTCIYITVVLNAPFISKTTSAIISLETYNIFFLISVPVTLLLLAIIIQCFCAFRWITKPFLIIQVFVSSVVFYSTVSYGVVYDRGMVQNIIETDSAEFYSYFNMNACLIIAFFGILPSLLIFRARVVYSNFFNELVNRLKLFSICLAVLFLIIIFFYSNYASLGRNHRNLVKYITPYVLIDSIVKYVHRNYLYPPLKFTLIDTAPSITTNQDTKSVMVLVIGETARSKNFSLNGYQRKTNKYTEHLGVVSFQDVSSCGTSTAVSIPCMFSRLDFNDYDKRIANAQQNALDIIHLAGADVLWISNNNGYCKGVCERIQSERISTSQDNQLCDGKYCFDEVLVDKLENKLRNIRHRKTLIVLHMIGSHGPTYYRRYPKKRTAFNPSCDRSDIQNCSREQLNNTYDNTIAYTDYVLSLIISELNKVSSNSDIATSMLYISDHGESLGEKGIYLHGLPYSFAPEEQTKIPLIYWADKLHHNDKVNCLNSIKSYALSHDNLFDILLGEMEVESISYRPEMNPFRQCDS